MDINYYKKYEPIDGKWYIARELGKGAFGTVLEVERRDHTNMKSALKIVSVPADSSEVESYRDENYELDEQSVSSYFYGFVEEFTKEIQLMSEIKGHRNIVAIEDYDVIEHTDEIGWDIFIRMELLTPMNKHFRENPPKTRDIIKLGIDICKALEVCQKHKITHRDIKPSNIFISKTGDFKLGDFGVSRTLEKTSSVLSKKGTYTYMAPEVFKGEAYGSNVDIYSLGIVLYKMLNNNSEPFRTDKTFNDGEKAMIKRMSGTPVPPPANAEGRLAEIVLKACSFNPKDRYESPLQMRSELESILYTEAEKFAIYPTGDEVAYEPSTSGNTIPPVDDDNDKTISLFTPESEPDENKTVGLFIDETKAEEENTPDSPEEPSVAVSILPEEAPEEEPEEEPIPITQDSPKTDYDDSESPEEPVETARRPISQTIAILILLGVLAMIVSGVLMFVLPNKYISAPSVTAINLEAGMPAGSITLETFPSKSCYAELAACVDKNTSMALLPDETLQADTTYSLHIVLHTCNGYKFRADSHIYINGQSVTEWYQDTTVINFYYDFTTAGEMGATDEESMPNAETEAAAPAENYSASEYDSVSSYVGNYAIVTKNGKYGLIDRNNNILFSCEYDELEINPNSCFISAYKKGGYGILNAQTQTVVLPFEYSYMQFANISGKTYAIATKSSVTQALIDLETGKVLLPFEYNLIYQDHQYPSVFIIVQGPYKGVADANGNIILDCVYDYVIISRDGSYDAKKDGTIIKGTLK